MSGLPSAGIADILLFTEEWSVFFLLAFSVKRSSRCWIGAGGLAPRFLSVSFGLVAEEFWHVRTAYIYASLWGLLWFCFVSIRYCLCLVIMCLVQKLATVFSFCWLNYSRNALSALNSIFKFLLLSLGWYLCWWTISNEGYHPPSSRCIGTLFRFGLVWWCLTSRCWIGVGGMSPRCVSVSCLG